MAMRDGNGEITRNTSVRINVIGFIGMIIVIVGSVFSATMFIASLKSGSDALERHIETDQHPAQADQNRIFERQMLQLQASTRDHLKEINFSIREIKKAVELNSKKLVGKSRHGWHRPNVRPYCEAVRRANPQLDLKNCPDPYKEVPVWGGE